MKRFNCNILKLLLLISLISLCFPSSINAQEITKDSLEIRALLQHKNSYDMKDKFRQDLLNSPMEYKLRLQTPKTINLPPKYEMPTHNLNLKATTDLSILPSNAYSIGDYSRLYLNYGQNNVPGISTVNTASATFRIQPTEDWFINIGSTASKYRDHSGFYNNLTIDASTYIPIAENFGLNVYGSYSTNVQNNANAGTIMHSPFAPSSYYGGSVEIRITERFGIEAGMIREFNMWTRKWENVNFCYSQVL